MKQRPIWTCIALLISISSLAQQSNEPNNEAREKKWLIEPIKISSLMVNAHPEYNGWGFELGRRVTDKLWVTTMIEKTKGGDFLNNFDPDFDYLINFHYFAWLNTARYYLKPDAKYSTFFDAGFEVQKASHKFLRDGDVFAEKATAMGPILQVGGELQLGHSMYFKWRMGGLINVYRSGSMKSRINDGQNQPAFYLYPHLSDAVLKRAIYAGDVGFGIKF